MQTIFFSFDDEGVREVESSLTCKLGRGEEGRVCYVIPVKGGSERKVSVEDGLTKILQSLHGNHTTIVWVIFYLMPLQRQQVRSQTVDRNWQLWH